MSPRSASRIEECCYDCANCHKSSDSKEHASGIPLSLSKTGEKGVIIRITGREEVRRYLEGLGFTTGTHVSTVCLDSGGVILDVKGSKIAVDGRMASRIMFCPER